jgi:hypothetical protein
VGRFLAVGPAGQAFFLRPWLAAAQLGPAATATRPGILQPDRVEPVSEFLTVYSFPFYFDRDLRGFDPSSR